MALQTDLRPRHHCSPKIVLAPPRTTKRPSTLVASFALVPYAQKLPGSLQ